MLGMEKKVDELGRIVIPKEYREFYHFDENVCLVQTERGVLITNPNYKMVRVAEN